jgi:tetratricopeptide (TPR) repeat protein
MPPEQAAGEIDQLDRRCDVFSLGAMLCAILTGQPPYVGSLNDVKRQARNADLKPAYARLEESRADAQLIALARACLSAEPNDRPEDASVVEKRLTGYLASVQERLRQTERDRAAAQARAEEEERTRRVAEKMAEAERRERRLAEEARRRMRWLAAVLACALLALVAASLFAWQAHVAERKRQDAEQAREAEERRNAIDKALTAAMGADLDAAAQAIKDAERAGASTGQVRMLRGQIALHRGQSREAREHLEQAVRLLPDSVAARGMLAAAYASDGQWESYGKMIKEMETLCPSTPEDFLFKGYAKAYLEPKQGLEMIQQAFDLRPMSIALLLRAEVRAMVAQDTDDLDEADRAVRDAESAKELLRKNPAALWVSLEAHLAKAGVHEHLGATAQRSAELKLAGNDADALKPFTALPEAVVYRWLYFRELHKEEKVLDELRSASAQTDHQYVAFCYALTLYRRGGPGDLEEALRVLKKNPGSSKDSLLPFVLAELHYDPANPNWQVRALQACTACAERSQNGNPLDSLTVLYFLGRKEDAVKASQEWQKHPERIYPLRQPPLLRCVRYTAGDPTMTADDLLQSAKGSRWNQCLAHYCVAMTKLAEGDRQGAREHFDKVVKTRAFIWGAYDMSWVFRARLAKPHNWPPWIPPR